LKTITTPAHTIPTEMLITRIRTKECRAFLERVGFGRLACSSNNRPYIVPIYFVYDRERLYCFSTLGQKIEWMRENPLICVEADEIRAHDDWTTVIVFGRYVEIPNTPDNRKGWEYARSLVRKRSQWWQSGYTITQLRRQPKPPVPLFYCILIENLSGVRASPDISESSKSRTRVSTKG
jgi:nitroimidazol reductase NimA-like FMN-containing flavoprotein (pyridoxamine 5'-phosphate oxidase superfamily)